MEHGSQLVLLDLVLVLGSLVTFILDLVINSLVAYNHLIKNDYGIAFAVLLSLFLPGIVTSVLSCCWLTGDISQSRENLPSLFHVFQILTTIFLVSPISG